MVMDFWTGWYDAWGELHHVLPPEGKTVSPDFIQYSNFAL